MGKKFEHSHLINSAKSGAGRRALAARLPKIIETPKTALLLYGHATSNIGKALLGDLQLLKKPGCRKLQRKNEVLPFEAGGEVHLENLCRLNDCSLFALVNHTKKRPDNLIMGRTFGFRILDMFEFAIQHFKPMALFPNRPHSPPGSAPLLVFQGLDWPAHLQSTLLDWFRLPHDIKHLNTAGVDRVIVLTLKSVRESTDDGESGVTRISFKHFEVRLRKRKSTAQVDEANEENSVETPLPSSHLMEIGPSFELVLRREQTAPDSMRSEAMRKPKDPAAPRKKKNVSTDDLGDKIGRVHVGRQDLSDLALARMKGLGKKRKASQLDDSENTPQQTNTAAENDLPDVAPVSPSSIGNTSDDGAETKRIRFDDNHYVDEAPDEVDSE